MEELTTKQLRHELLNLDRSNGWGVDFKPNLYVQRKHIIAEIEALVEEFGAYPIEQSLESEYDLIIVKNNDGGFTYGIRMEVSMLNYQKFEESGKPLNNYAVQFTNYFFKNHINRIRVLT